MTSVVLPNFSSRFKFIDDFFTANENSACHFAPPCDVVQQEKGYSLQMDLPGVDKEQITIDYQNGVLTISGKRAEAAAKSKESYYLNERPLGAFKRAFIIKDIDDNAIKAGYEHGVLSIYLPKKEEAKAKKISISDQPPLS